MAAVDGLFEDVRVTATQALDLLLQTLDGVFHQISIAARPELIAVGDRARHAATDGVDEVFGHGRRRERRQLAVPVDRARTGLGRIGASRMSGGRWTCAGVF